MTKQSYTLSNTSKGFEFNNSVVTGNLRENLIGHPIYMAIQPVRNACFQYGLIPIYKLKCFETESLQAMLVIEKGEDIL